MASLTRMICLSYLINRDVAITCHIPFECSDQTLTISDPDKQGIPSYKGAFGASTSFDGWKLGCGGSFSCHSMADITAHSMTDDGIICRGRNSCSNTSHMQCTNCGIGCDGSQSCSYSNITLIHDSLLWCRGYSSCSNTNIYVHSSNTIEAYGSLSLYQAIIDTISDISDTFTLYLRGKLSAFGAQLRCNVGHICNIYCQVYDACHMFYVQCTGNCNIYLASTSFGTAINPINITNVYAFNHSLTESIPKFFASQAMIPYNDALCTIDEWNFDNYQEHMDGSSILVDTYGPICCRAHDSCRNVSALAYESKINNDLICGGYQSCRDSIIISNNGTIYCEAQSACQLSTISDANDVYCIGSWSCRDSIITNTLYIVCGGYLSCLDSTFISGDTGTNYSVFITGYKAGLGTKIYCDATDICHIYCSGEISCAETTLYCVHNCDVVCTATATASCPVLINGPTLDPTTNFPNYATFDPTFYPTKHTFDTSANPKNNPTLSAAWNLTETMLDISETLSLSTSLSTLATDEMKQFTSESIDSSSPDNTIKTAIYVEIILICTLLIIAICFGILYTFNKKQCESTQRRMKENGAKKEAEEIQREIPSVDIVELARRKECVEVLQKRNKDAVALWLRDIVGLSQYYPLFINNGYESVRFVKKMTEISELKDIGIESMIHQEHIMFHIELLRNKQMHESDDNSSHESMYDDYNEGLKATTTKGTEKGDKNGLELMQESDGNKVVQLQTEKKENDPNIIIMESVSGSISRGTYNTELMMKGSAKLTLRDKERNNDEMEANTMMRWKLY